jgi:hypothetical protein
MASVFALMVVMGIVRSIIIIAGGDDCRELRLACLHKDELGEQGQGNCQRYREICQSRY